jgi:hypothetical protein
VANSTEQWLILPWGSVHKNLMAGDTCWIGEPCVVKTSPGNIGGTFDADITYWGQGRAVSSLTRSDVVRLPLGYAISVSAFLTRDWMARSEVVLIRIDEYRLLEIPDTHPAIRLMVPLPDDYNIALVDGEVGRITPKQGNTMNMRQWMLRILWESDYSRYGARSYRANPRVLVALVRLISNRCVPRRKLMPVGMTR